MKYRILNANGRICCSGDRLELLCDSCRAKATSTSVPAPPSFAAALRAKRGLPEPQPEPRTAATGGPAVPDLIGRIQSQGPRRRQK